MDYQFTEPIQYDSPASRLITDITTPAWINMTYDPGNIKPVKPAEGHYQYNALAAEARLPDHLSYISQMRD